MRPVEGPRVLYVVYWGALEPLGRTLVLPAVARLAAAGVDLTLVTFDKPADWVEPAVAEVRAELARANVSWIPLRYHKRPKIPATAFDLAAGVLCGWTAGRGKRFDVVHARTFAGGLIGLALAPLVGAKLVYHNEGFYPDEQVDGGVWRAGSLPHRVARALERRLYDHADGIIAMSRRSRDAISAAPAVRARATPVVVVPSCVDVERFPSPPARVRRAGDRLRLVYVGSVGARYRLDAVARFAAVASRRAAGVELRVCTREDASRVADILTGAGLPPSAFSIAAVAPSAIPAELASRDAGLLFYAPGSSAYGGSPTKIGEYWAAGLPIVASANAGDVDEIVARERVGVIVDGIDDRAYTAALDRLLPLLEEPGLAARCRAAAERHYGLESACLEQAGLYRRLLDRRERIGEPAVVAS